ncbi:uncharacterized protein SPPG_08852 [Spizellomyces punctatus DAOM BR117]|uniref:Uncharacterized protein n=1 Tax=Spizellomyces punctatus (strain DAOM BR117) TaxID=645134 RepID=A0A0L0HUJ7_SPIPD|nr:uncharacterized protein SPPG_08852 [Spizellomyces punctatus DAOM BR117]KND04762.1 hypothetical protein SPPG_08852 [Spizellomyces punctatus DAOM BR117]|eukprot:XP_016612801.1 hypothetical protein SPPG_08852 [Spizellomyces punctatus DAOM BR117]
MRRATWIGSLLKSVGHVPRVGQHPRIPTGGNASHRHSLVGSQVIPISICSSALLTTQYMSHIPPVEALIYPLCGYTVTYVCYVVASRPRVITSIFGGTLIVCGMVACGMGIIGWIAGRVEDGGVLLRGPTRVWREGWWMVDEKRGIRDGKQVRVVGRVPAWGIWKQPQITTY